MSTPPRPRPGPCHCSASDLRGLYRLGVDGSVGLTDLVEAMHHTIASRIGFDRASPDGRSSGLTGVVYGAVRGGMRWVGHGVDAALRLVETASAAAGAGRARARRLHRRAQRPVGRPPGRQRQPAGHPHGAAQRRRGAGPGRARAGRALPAPSRKLLVLVHGLCMNDRQWTRRGHDHGQALAQALGFTPLYLHYNSGRHVSQNGRDFAALLQQLLHAWPVPVDELVILGHSMGGLVARSACHHAASAGSMAWLRSLTTLVCLGTPHHGAPLERGGRWLDLLLGLSPYVAPFARLGKARSAGITDLRFGNLQDADWQGRDRHAQQHDDRRPTPLPAGVATYLLAATTADAPGRLHRALIGDGLVPLASALGEHRDPALALQVPADQRHVVAGCGHLDLLCHEEVQAQLLRWLGPRRRA